MLLMGDADHFEAWTGVSDEQRDEFFAGLRAFSDAVAERGAVVAGEGLDQPKAARVVRPGPDRPVTDGPYAESTEHLGGFYVVDLPDMETVLELARLLPDTVPGTSSRVAVEVRPAVDG